MAKTINAVGEFSNTGGRCDRRCHNKRVVIQQQQQQQAAPPLSGLFQ